MLINGFYIGKKIIRLTFLQSLIMQLLIEDKGSVVTYKELEKYTQCSRLALKKHIHKLRKIFENEFEIYTERNIGYFI